MYSAFLTPAEQSLIMRVDEFFGCISFDGGTEEAERRLCRIRTDEYQPDDGAPIALLSVAVTDTSAEISHRDVLGSLMGLGIRRDMIGDIFAAGIECGVEYAFTKADGFRLGCSVLFDISDFSQNADFSTRRFCIMPYLGYWF